MIIFEGVNIHSFVSRLNIQRDFLLSATGLHIFHKSRWMALTAE